MLLKLSETVNDQKNTALDNDVDIYLTGVIITLQQIILLLQ